MQIRIEQQGPGFFAEVRGVGLADVIESDAAYAAVRAAFEEHSVLLFRDQTITGDLQAAYSPPCGTIARSCTAAAAR